MKLFVATVLTFSPVFLFAAIEVQKLKLPEALKKGFEYSPELKKAESSIKEYESTLSKTRGSLFPTINATATATTRQNSSTFTGAAGAFTNGGATGETYTAGLSLSQPIIAGGAISAGLSLAKASIESSRQKYFSTKQDVAQKIISAFYSLAQSQQQLDAGIQNRDILKSYVNITAHYEKIGRSRKMDRLQAAVNYSLSLADMEQTTNNLRISEASLKKLLGITEHTSLEASHSVSITPIEKLTPEQAFKAAQKNNPLIRVAQIAMESVEYNKDVDLATDYPTMSLTGSFGYQSPDRGSLFNNTSQTYSIGLNLTVPLFSGLTSFAKRSIYGEKLYQAKHDLQSTEDDLKNKIESALSSLQSSKMQLEIAQNSVKEARSALDLANRGYQQGVASSLDVVNLQKTRYESEKLLVNSQFGYMQNLLTLRQLMGIDLEKSYAK